MGGRTTTRSLEIEKCVLGHPRKFQDEKVQLANSGSVLYNLASRMARIQIGEQTSEAFSRISESHPLGDSINRVILAAALLNGLEIYEQQYVSNKANINAFKSNLLLFMAGEGAGEFKVAAFEGEAAGEGGGICVYRKGFGTSDGNTAFILRRQTSQDGQGRAIEELHIDYARTTKLDTGLVGAKPTLPQLVYRYRPETQQMAQTRLMFRDREPGVVSSRRLQGKDFPILTGVIDQISSFGDNESVA